MIIRKDVTFQGQRAQYRAETGDGFLLVTRPTVRHFGIGEESHVLRGVYLVSTLERHVDRGWIDDAWSMIADVTGDEYLRGEI